MPRQTCPRSHSCPGAEPGPGVGSLLPETQTSGGNQGPKQASAAGCLGPERGWQDSPLSTEHSMILDKSLPLAGLRYQFYAVMGWQVSGHPGQGHTCLGRALPSFTGDPLDPFLEPHSQILRSWLAGTQEVGTPNWSWPCTGGEKRRGAWRLSLPAISASFRLCDLGQVPSLLCAASSSGM